ncbi:unnamed protein product [Amoebophrya sp. A25]|nr:unnamed protein product [Amoebophrya sp. A25]|eukprot:GSA25T00017634001.1
MKCFAPPVLLAYVLFICEVLCDLARLGHENFLTLDEYREVLARKRLAVWRTKPRFARGDEQDLEESGQNKHGSGDGQGQNNVGSRHDQRGLALGPGHHLPEDKNNYQLQEQVKFWQSSVKDLERYEVLFAVMASRTMEWRVTVMEATCLKDMPHVKYVVEEYLDSVPESRQWKVSFRKQAGGGVRKSKNADVWKVRKEYMKVQRQQLEFITQHKRLPPEIKWIMLLDDDTYFDWPQMSRMLRVLDPSDPVLLSYILSDAQVIGYDYPCGGAGMILSRQAYDVIAKPLADDDICPFSSFNDLTLGLCLSTYGVPMVHSPLMHCMPTLNMAGRSWENMNDVQEQVAFHRLIASTNLEGLVDMLDAKEENMQAMATAGHGCLMSPRGGEKVIDVRTLVVHERQLGRFSTECRKHFTSVSSGTTTSSTGDFFTKGNKYEELVRAVWEFDPEVKRQSHFDPEESGLLFQLFDDFHIGHMQARKYGPFEAAPTGRQGAANTVPAWVNNLVESGSRERPDMPKRWKVQVVPERAFPALERVRFDADFSDVVRRQTKQEADGAGEEIPLEAALWPRFPDDTDFEHGRHQRDWIDIVVENFQQWRAEKFHKTKSRTRSPEQDMPGDSCGSDWTFLSFYGSTTYVNVGHLTLLIRHIHEFFPCTQKDLSAGRQQNEMAEGGELRSETNTGLDEGEAEGSSTRPVEDQNEDDFPISVPPEFDLVSAGLPPIAVAYVHTESHIEPAAGVLLNAGAVDVLSKCPATLKENIINKRLDNLHPDLHKFIPVDDELVVEFKQRHGFDLSQSQLQDNILGADLFVMLRFCGVLLVHSRRFAPQLQGLITYSTWRRPHRSPISELVTAGAVFSKQRMAALTLYGGQRRRWLKTKKDSASDETALGAPRFRYEHDIQRSRIPGGVLVGDVVMTYRSEHFLADAQATNDKRIRKKNEA